MGYYTRYTLSLDTGEDAEEFISQNRPRLLAELGEDGLEYLEYSLDESAKWYEHETDMCKISAAFPRILFTLQGEGEEAGDIWVKYFLNGKCQICLAQITFEPFDINKLK